MEPIIPQTDKELIKAELTPSRKLRDTNKSGNEIYIFNGNDCPALLREVGRLREISFRTEGGGSGLSCDLDAFDTMEKPYWQLIVWDPDAEAILGGYRYIFGSDIQLDDKGQPLLATSHMFNFSEEFIKDYLPYTIELGRSFVVPEYQSSKAGTKALFALDNLWDGLAALMLIKPDMRYYFGKMTMYPSFDRHGRDLILYFLDKHFGDEKKLVTPYKPIQIVDSGDILNEDSFKGDYSILNARVRSLGFNIPPLFNSYMKLSSTMKVFGTAVNDEFSDVEETAILINFDEMYEDRIARHVGSFIKWKLRVMRLRFPRMMWLQRDEIEKKFFERLRKRRSKAGVRSRSITTMLEIK
ncbi:MAG: GNAT family N-acetyltransferase [Bacteroidales bacterium]|nr:GNAT family N-acetyltransferase [Bacteroidales bacterium]